MLDALRQKLAAAETLPQLLIIAGFSAIMASIVIICFRVLIEIGQILLLPDSRLENYESLDWWARLLYPTLGGLLIGWLFYRTAPEHRVVGVVYVLERLHYFQGKLPLRNAVQQFIGATMSIISGHSVGREGPSVHLGATSASLLGQWLQLPNNSMRTLIACGTAAAIAASFNTPLAGIIFAMEVVMLEYTLTSFLPVILAAVIGALMLRAFYGEDIAFNLPDLANGNNLWTEIPYLALMGVVLGMLAVAFNQLLLLVSRIAKPLGIGQKMTLAGFGVGVIGLMIPAVMGIGYDSVDYILHQQPSVMFLLLLVVGKLVATTWCLGLGIPGGLIGPVFFIGAAAGGVFGVLAQTLFSDSAAPIAVYALLGMGAMMSATLQAPLSALTAVLELTHSPSIILPQMLVIVVANIIANHPPFNQTSVFITLLRIRGFDYQPDPMHQALQRIGLVSVMVREFGLHYHQASRQNLALILANAPEWLVVTDDKSNGALMQRDEILDYLTNHVIEHDVWVDLLDIPAERLTLQRISHQATVHEGLAMLHQSQCEALLVVDAGQTPVGIVTQAQLAGQYQKLLSS